MSNIQQTQNICITFIVCSANVENVGPMLYKCYTNVLCLLGNQLKSESEYIGLQALHISFINQCSPLQY